MGTRALIVLKEGPHTELAVIYSQWDGYPAGLGRILGEILGPYAVGNGIPCGKVFTKPFANGPADLAVHLICELKSREWAAAIKTAELVSSKSYPSPSQQYPAQIGHIPGSYYLYPAGTRDTRVEWLYFVWVGEEGTVRIRVAQAKDGHPDGLVVWEGTAKDLAKKSIWNKIGVD